MNVCQASVGWLVSGWTLSLANFLLLMTLVLRTKK